MSTERFDFSHFIPTASREDFEAYFSCPKKLALKVMGVRVRKPSEKAISVPAYAIGKSGEKLTEEILEIIASLQVEEEKGEYVERISKVEAPIEVVKSKLKLIEALRGKPEEIKSLLSEEEIKEAIWNIADFSVEEGFKPYEETSELYYGKMIERYKAKLLREQTRKFGKILGGLSQLLPKIERVYKPRLKNSDVCSIGFPDFQCDTAEGPILLEVKNLADEAQALKEGEADLRYYSLLLADKELGRSEHHIPFIRSIALPKPTKSILILPRQGKVVSVDVSDDYRSFRDIAVEIWKIKRAAIAEGRLPDVRPIPSVCKRCGYKKYCEEGESLEEASPLTLIYTVAYDEAASEGKVCVAPLFPRGFWDAYGRLKQRRDDPEILDKLKLMEEFISFRYEEVRRKELKSVYESLPDSFDSWGGLELLRQKYFSLRNISWLLYGSPSHREREVLRIARRRWNI